MNPDQIADAGPAIVHAIDIGTTLVVAKGIGPGFFNLDNILTPQNIALIVVSWSLTELISRSSKGWSLRDHVLPVLPLLFCELFVFLTASWQPTATMGERALLGALLGTVTVWGHTVANKTGLQGFLPFMKTADPTPAPALSLVSSTSPEGAKENGGGPKKEVDGGSTP